MTDFEPAPERNEPASKKRTWKQRMRSWSVDLVLFGLIFGGVQWWQTRNLVPTGDHIAQATMIDLAGNKIQMIDESRGTVVYLFSPWCSICKFSTPNLNDFHKDASESGFRVLGMGLSWQTLDELRAYQLEYDIQFPVVAAGPSIAKQFNISAYPTIYLIDNKGKILSRTVGFTTETGLKIRAWANKPTKT